MSGQRWRIGLVQWPAIVGLLLFGLSIWAIAQQLHDYSGREILGHLAAIPKRHVGLAIALTALNYLVLTGYDGLALKYIQHPLPYRQPALVGVMSAAISNSIGFALLSASAIRYRFYRRWGLSIAEVTQIIAFVNLSFFLGLLAAGGLMFILEPIGVPAVLHLPFKSVHSIGIIFLLGITGYVFSSALSRSPLYIWRWSVPHLPIQLCLAQILVASCDWAFAAAALYVLLPNLPLAYPIFFGIYLLAQLAGLISNVPGGLGVFETVMLLLLSPHVAPAVLFGALLAYRGIYYWLPLGASVVGLLVYELWFTRRPS